MYFLLSPDLSPAAAHGSRFFTSTTSAIAQRNGQVGIAGNARKIAAVRWVSRETVYSLW